MAKTINRLDDAKIKNGKYDPPASAKNPQYTHDGNGLYLRVTPGGTRTFLRRYFRNGHAHWLSLGTYPTIKLKEAREESQRQGELLRQKRDPIEERQREIVAEERAKVVEEMAEGALIPAVKPTFKECAEAYEKAHRLEWTNAAYRRDWLGAFKNHVFPIIGGVPIDEVDRATVKDVLFRIWETKTKTAKDLRGRIAKVLGWAEKEGFRPSGPNPAAWKDDLEFSLARPSAIAPAKPHEALPYKRIAKFMADLRAVPTVIARALEFTILCASRTGEVRFAQWSEIDLKARTWTIPKARMKTRKHVWAVDHTVPLSTAAADILLALKGDQEPEPSDYIFSQPAGRPIGVNAMRRVMWTVAGTTKFKPHGFRSCFSDWVGDCTTADEETREFCLAHVKAGVSGRYRRGTAINKRRVLLEQWAKACAGGTVVPFEREREAA